MLIFKTKLKNLNIKTYRSLFYTFDLSNIYFTINLMNRTIIKKLSYIGAALNEGQIKKGVSKGPDSIRNTGIFRHLQEIYGLN